MNVRLVVMVLTLELRLVVLNTVPPYWFVLEEPVSLFDVTSWFLHHQEMIDALNGILDFIDMNMQGELPF